MAVEVKIIQDDNGDMTIAGPSGASVEEAKAAVQRVNDALGTDLPFVMEGEIEQHKHTEEEIRAHSRSHAHA
jgi:hypothetical protein